MNVSCLSLELGLRQAVYLTSPEPLRFTSISPLPPRAIPTGRGSAELLTRGLCQLRGQYPPHVFSFQHSLVCIGAKPSWYAATDFQHNGGAGQELLSSSSHAITGMVPRAREGTVAHQPSQATRRKKVTCRAY